MYEIRPASATYFDLMIPLLLETGYYEYMAADNKLAISTGEFLKTIKLNPDLEHTRILIDHSVNGDDSFAGFFITYPQKESRKISYEDLQSLRDDDDMKNGILQLDEFYHEGVADEYLIADTAAIHPAHRGKGLYRTILNYRREIARTAGCSKMKIATWESNPSSKIFEHCGVKFTGKIDLSSTDINDRILKGIFDFKIG